ncbi:MAG: hypothetical protein GC191_06015 [Azospirillum sp.]|nr:hypothetical protein [Azospirillum sp.]
MAGSFSVGLVAPIAAFTAIARQGRNVAAPANTFIGGPKRSGGWREGTILLRDAKPGARAMTLLSSRTKGAPGGGK